MCREVVTIALLVVTSQAWPQNQGTRENYSSGWSGFQLSQQIIPSQTFNVTHEQILGTGLVVPSSGTYGRRYDAGILVQRLPDNVEQATTETVASDDNKHLHLLKEQETVLRDINCRVQGSDGTRNGCGGSNEQIKVDEFPVDTGDLNSSITESIIDIKTRGKQNQALPLSLYHESTESVVPCRNISSGSTERGSSFVSQPQDHVPSSRQTITKGGVLQEASMIYEEPQNTTSKKVEQVESDTEHVSSVTSDTEHESSVTSDAYISNNDSLQRTVPADSGTGQRLIMRFNHSESVLFTSSPDINTRNTNITSSSDEQMPRMGQKSRILTSLGTFWKTHWVHKGRNTTQSSSSSGGSKIVFPGEVESNTVVKYMPQVNGRRPKCANENTFCEAADNYPHDYLKRLLENDENIYPQYFGSDLMDVDVRIRPDDEMTLCPSMEQVVYPKMAQNKEEKWLFVINQDSYIQGIRIEKCAKQGSCTFSENFPPGYVTNCQQKYIYRKLLALGEDGKPASDSFRLPSCCACVVTKSLALGRMAEDTEGESGSPATTRRKRS